ncbi:MAG: phage tail tape measure protein [Leuconostoc mesenteroides]
MAGSVKHVVLETRLDGAGLNAGLKQASQNIRTATNQWKADFSRLSSTGDFTSALGTKIKGLGKVLDEEKIKLREIKQAMIDAGQDGGRAGQNLITAYKEQSAQVAKLEQQLKKTRAAYAVQKTGIKDLRDESKMLQLQTEQASRIQGALNNKYSEARVKASGYSEQMRNLKSQIDAQRQALSIYANELGSSSDEYKKTSANVTKLTGDLRVMEAEYSQLGKQVGNATLGQTLTADKLVKSGDKMLTAGRNISMAGATMVPVTYAVGAALADGAKKSIDLNNTLTETYQIITDGNGTFAGQEKFIASYGEQIRGLSVKWGVSQKSIAVGMQEVIRAGYDQKTALGIASGALKTSAATGEDYGKILSGTTQIMSQFGLNVGTSSQKVKAAAKVNSMIAKVANDTQTSYVGLSQAMTKVGPIAKNMGYSVQETAAMIGYMSNRGIDASQAGNNLRMVMQRLAAPTADAAGALKELGISANDSKGDMRALPDIMADLEEKTKKMGSAEKQQYIKRIFGAYATTAANALLDGTPEIEKEAKAAGDAASNGYTDSLAKGNMKSAQMQIKVFTAQFDAMKIEFAEKVLPTIISVMKEIRNLMSAFDDLSPSQKKMIANTVLIAAAVGPLLIAFGGLTAGVGAFLKVAGKLSMMVSVAGWLATGRKEAGLFAKSMELMGLSTTKGTGMMGLLGKGATTAGASVAGAGSAISGTSATIGGLETAGAAAAGGLGMTALAVTGVVAAAALGVGALYLYNKHQIAVSEQAAKSAEKVKTYGADVSDATAKQLDGIQANSVKTQYALSQLGDAKINTGELDNAKKAMDNFSDSVDKAYEKKNSNLDSKIKEIDTLISKTSGQTRQALENEKAWLLGSKANNQQTIDQLSENKKKAAEIYDQISKQGGQATKDQINALNEINKQTVNAAVDSMKKLKKPVREAIKQALDNQDLSKQSLTTLENSFGTMTKIIGNNLKDQVSATKEAAKYIKKETAWNDFFKNNAEAIKPMADTMSAALKKVETNTLTGLPSLNAYGEAVNGMRKQVEAAGIDWDQYRVHFGVATESQMAGMTNLIQIGAQWNSQTLGIKKAEFKTAGIEQLSGGMIKFKDFNNMTDAERKATIKSLGNQDLTALIAKGSEFDQKAPEAVKKAVLKSIGKGDVDQAIDTAKNFNSLPEGIKTLTTNAKGKEQVDQATAAVQLWNGLPEKAKTALAKKSGDDQVKFITNMLNNWNQLPTKVKTVIGKQLGKGDVDAASRSLDNFNSKNPKPKQVKSSQTGKGSVDSASSSLDKFNGKRPQHKTVTTSQIGKGNVDASSSSLDNFNGKRPQHKTVFSSQSGKGNVDAATRSIDNFSSRGNSYRRVTLDSIVNNITNWITKKRRGGATSAAGFEGGDVWLGDGGKNEPYVTPQGQVGISPSDWTATNLPQGTKIYPSISAMKTLTGVDATQYAKIPKFASGGTYRDTVNANNANIQALNKVNSVQNGSTTSPTTIMQPVDMSVVMQILEVLTTTLPAIQKSSEESLNKNGFPDINTIAKAVDQNLALNQVLANRSRGM